MQCMGQGQPIPANAWQANSHSLSLRGKLAVCLRQCTIANAAPISQQSVYSSAQLLMLRSFVIALMLYDSCRNIFRHPASLQLAVCLRQCTIANAAPISQQSVYSSAQLLMQRSFVIALMLYDKVSWMHLTHMLMQN
eukprot:jgi/Chrzof1/2823/Cz12g00050.t1